MNRGANNPAAGKAGIARLSAIEHHFPGLPIRVVGSSHMRMLALILTSLLCLTTSATAFPNTNAIAKAEFSYGGTDRWIPVALAEARSLIAIFPLFGALKGWDYGLRRDRSERIDPPPLYYHLKLTMTNGLTKGVSVSLGGALVSYHQYGLRQVPKDLRATAEKQLEIWHLRWAGTPNNSGAASGSQPIRSETNSTSSAAVSRR